jgi:halimadienyl-diphosphate synthase
MTNPTGFVLSREEIDASTERLLVTLGAGSMDSVPYDTAWIARLAPVYPGRGFEQAIDWLRRNQHPDGSWGSPLLHYHDRFICTLSAIIALRIVGQGARDQKRVQRGEEFMWHAIPRLHQDFNETIAFPLLVTTLSKEAESLGLNVPRVPYPNAAINEKKLTRLSHVSSASWRQFSICFSLEAVNIDLPSTIDFLEVNGSVGASPSATAAMLLRTSLKNEDAVKYLLEAVEVQPDGGVADAVPIDTFELAWSLNSLRLAGAIPPDHPEVKRALDLLWKAWSAEKGIGFSAFSSVTDLDCTSTSFAVLRWGGYPVDPDVFAPYELDDHFFCFRDEADISLSAHIRILAALRMLDPQPRTQKWISKIMNVLRRFDLEGQFWCDKWHISPYYLRCMAVYALQGIGNDLAGSCIDWITRTQQPDGGWGFYGQSTLEETSYGLLSLLHWDRTVERVDADQIEAAARFLSTRVQENYLEPLWIGKCLYTPRHVVRATALAALCNYMTYRS